MQKIQILKILRAPSIRHKGVGLQMVAGRGLAGLLSARVYRNEAPLPHNIPTCDPRLCL